MRPGDEASTPPARPPPSSSRPDRLAAARSSPGASGGKMLARGRISTPPSPVAGWSRAPAPNGEPKVDAAATAASRLRGSPMLIRPRPSRCGRVTGGAAPVRAASTLPERRGRASNAAPAFATLRALRSQCTGSGLAGRGCIPASPRVDGGLAVGGRGGGGRDPSPAPGTTPSTATRCRLPAPPPLAAAVRRLDVAAAAAAGALAAADTASAAWALPSSKQPPRPSGAAAAPASSAALPRPLQHSPPASLSPDAIASMSRSERKPKDSERAWSPPRRSASRGRGRSDGASPLRAASSSSAASPAAAAEGAAAAIAACPAGVPSPDVASRLCSSRIAPRAPRRCCVRPPSSRSSAPTTAPLDAAAPSPGTSRFGAVEAARASVSQPSSAPSACRSSIAKLRRAAAAARIGADARVEGGDAKGSNESPMTLPIDPPRRGADGMAPRSGDDIPMPKPELPPTLLPQVPSPRGVAAPPLCMLARDPARLQVDPCSSSNSSSP